MKVKIFLTSQLNYKKIANEKNFVFDRSLFYDRN